jgi:hypothetical protein
MFVLFLAHAARAQGVVRVGIGMMDMIVPVRMVVIVPMVMALMHMRGGVEIRLGNLARTDAFHMVVVAFLG